MTPSGSKGDSIYGQGEGDKAQDGGDMDGSRSMSLSTTSNSAIHGSLSLSHTHTHTHTLPKLTTPFLSSSSFPQLAAPKF
jgi:hypothetical protein